MINSKDKKILYRNRTGDNVSLVLSVFGEFGRNAIVITTLLRYLVDGLERLLDPRRDQSVVFVRFGGDGELTHGADDVVPQDAAGRKVVGSFFSVWLAPRVRHKGHTHDRV